MSKKNRKEQEAQAEAVTTQEIKESVEKEKNQAENPSPSQDPTEDASAEGQENHLKEALAQAEAEIASLKDQNLRLQADFQNFRKRKEKELAEHVRFANEDLIKHLLPILDNFDRTLAAIEKTDNLAAIKEGIGLVDHSMKKSLEKIGLKPIESKELTFDPNFHEAISTVPIQDEAKKGKVIDEVEKGYILKEKVIRYAKVIVGE